MVKMEDNIVRCGVEDYLRITGKNRTLVPADSHFYLTEMDEKLTGEISFNNPTNTAWNFFQNESFIYTLHSRIPKRGIARVLVELVEEEAKKERNDGIVLLSSNHPFWKYMGYTILKENKVLSLAIKGIK
jgi:hypothetical protein